MYINEYGNPKSPKIILLAPMLVSGEDLYRLTVPCFKGDYCFIAPDQGGHGKAGAYIGAEAEYQQLKKYLLEKDYTKIKLAFGASLGGAVAYRLYNDADFIVEKAWFDGVALRKSASFAEWLMVRVFRQLKRKLARNPDEVPGRLVKMYGHDFAKMMARNFKRVTVQDIDAICYACCHYDLNLMSKEKQASLHLEYGSVDPDYKLSKKSLSMFLPDIVPVIRNGYAHCGYMAAHPQAYAEEMERFING